MLICGLGGGCSPSGEKSPQAGALTETGASNSTPSSLREIKKETGEAVKAGQKYLFAQKDKFVEKMGSDLAKVNQEIDRLATKAEKAKDDIKADAETKLKALRDKSAALSGKLDQAKEATEANWEEVKSGCQKVYDEFEDALKNARQWWVEKFGE